jgi:hypothetical protein
MNANFKAPAATSRQDNASISDLSALEEEHAEDLVDLLEDLPKD